MAGSNINDVSKGYTYYGLGPTDFGQRELHHQDVLMHVQCYNWGGGCSFPRDIQRGGNDDNLTCITPTEIVINRF